MYICVYVCMCVCIVSSFFGERVAAVVAERAGVCLYMYARTCTCITYRKRVHIKHYIHFMYSYTCTPIRTYFFTQNHTHTLIHMHVHAFINTGIHTQVTRAWHETSKSYKPTRVVRQMTSLPNILSLDSGLETPHGQGMYACMHVCM